ncbi:hypothetical protein ACJJIC_16540 [Microbulbifer sp. ANSA002]|uniref:hypothetical protein n=1 Tax=unclassified Microbulbifer TaxID=2619833 RepID=UPI0040432362
MKKNKVIAFCVALFIAIIMYVLLLYGFNRPLVVVTGCYFQDDIEPFDRICLYKDGSYEQFSLNQDGKFESYNLGSWRSYPSLSGSEKIAGVTLSG